MGGIAGEDGESGKRFAGDVFGGGQGGSSCEAVRVKTAVTCEVEGSLL